MPLTRTVMEPGGRLYLGIDLGGTNVKAGVVADDATVQGYDTRATEAEKGPEAGLQQICDTARAAVEDAGLKLEEVAAVGLATPGTMDIPGGMLLDPPNLPGWENLPIRQQVEERLGRPTYLQNDANAAAFGEWWAGAGRDLHSLVLWTLGTGIGCGIIIGGMIVRGEHSHGSECGHIVIEYDGRLLPGTGQRGTLEAYASAKSLVARCREALQAGRPSSIAKRLDAGETLSPILVARCAEDGDELADELLMDTAMFLGIGTVSVMHTIDPDMFLFGGAMTFGRNESELGRRFLERIRREVRERGFPVPASKVAIDYATLGGDAGFIGAAGYAFEKHTRG